MGDALESAEDDDGREHGEKEADQGSVHAEGGVQGNGAMVLDCTELKQSPKVTEMSTAKRAAALRLPRQLRI